ncbi:Yip1 family protein [Pseudomonas berkeleyensis]|uniref:YIP1 family protein n=1 Tax=Pseudomonas berkeleyensis TaxID=2726956 RepID=A0A7G5DIR3_9PSED|nr:Yip1 family protein [Pseudomonas berkeleyensis]QMV61638.1 YIP1 family protein [Pseudomonas berkeleyensis]WSO37069.1 Yip1 family protein [Pseudomonas berkeleyensis]
MFMNPLTVLTHPDQAWTAIRQDEERNSASYLPYLLFWSLLPAVCLFIGTHWVGWSLVDEERIRLEAISALQLSVLLYLATLIGVIIMGYFLRYMSRTFEARPTFNQCIGFIAYTCTPFFLAGIAALYPTRWLAIGVLLLACAHAAYLMYVGLPRFMRIDNQQGFLYASSMLGVGLLVIVTILVNMILFWTYTLEPDYQRTVQQDQSRGTQEERMQAPGDE